MPYLNLRPAPTEHAPYALTYVDAAAKAMSHASHPTIQDVLHTQVKALHVLVDGVDQTTALRAYAPGKWSLLESLLHVADSERVFAYRLLRIARGDQTPLPGFDQDAWVPQSDANRRSLGDILTEIKAVRSATLALIESLDEVSAARTGISGGNPVSARALAWMIAGHFAHHLEITESRYLSGV